VNFFIILLDYRFQTIKLPLSSPLARNKPFGLMEIDLTQVVWKQYSTERRVGKGFKSFGLGSSGMSLDGSLMLAFFFNNLGHM
jgi:hypothetical protein